MAGPYESYCMSILRIVVVALSKSRIETCLYFMKEKLAPNQNLSNLKDLSGSPVALIQKTPRNEFC